MPRPVKAPVSIPAPSKSADQTRQIMALLFQQHPNAFTELNFRTPYELLVATILSAQSTDRGVNEVTPALFAKYPNATALAAAKPSELEVEIKTTGFFRQKSKALMGMAAAVVAQYGGEVPGVMESLVTLPGVGRKTANVVLSHAFGVPGLAVDRHVLRVSNRIGIALSAEPEVVEAQLCAAMPPEQWQLTSDSLILHGRRICRPFPLCQECAVAELCDFAAELRRNGGRAKARVDGQPARAPRGAKPAASRKAPVVAKPAGSARLVAKATSAAKSARPTGKLAAKAPAAAVPRLRATGRRSSK
jgi:endonuclease-3